MLASIPRRSHPTGVHRETRLPVVCVVDPKSEDYRPWAEHAKQNGLRVEIASTAAEALRIARTSRIDRWVINTSLPDLSGAELCEMLRSRSPSVPIALVSDEYSGAMEREAYRVRATLFGVKTAHALWLTEWLDSIPVRTTEAAM